MDKRLVFAAVLVVLACATYSMAAWEYIGRLGTVHGRFEPGGVIESFNLDLGTIYAGMSGTGNASSVIVVPEDTVLTIYGVPRMVYVSPDNSSPTAITLGTETNVTEEFNYTVNIYIDGVYKGTFDQDNNLTITIEKGYHEVTVIVTVYAPAELYYPASYTLEIYIST